MLLPMRFKGLPFICQLEDQHLQSSISNGCYAMLVSARRGRDSHPLETITAPCALLSTRTDSYENQNLP